MYGSSHLGDLSGGLQYLRISTMSEIDHCFQEKSRSFEMRSSAWLLRAATVAETAGRSWSN